MYMYIYIYLHYVYIWICIYIHIDTQYIHILYYIYMQYVSKCEYVCHHSATADSASRNLSWPCPGREGLPPRLTGRTLAMLQKWRGCRKLNRKPNQLMFIGTILIFRHITREKKPHIIGFTTFTDSHSASIEHCSKSLYHSIILYGL